MAGSGAAGLTAALAAASGGARVLLAERAAQIGGTTALSFGRVWVPASHHNPKDSPEAAREYLAALAAGLLDGVVRSGVRVLTGTRLLGVKRDGTARVTAAVVCAEGAAEEIPVSAVILATGGFDRNEELRARFLPETVSATGASPGNTGDAMRIATSVGAWLDNTAQGWWMPMTQAPGTLIDGEPYYVSLIRERALPRQIIVNAAGRRFTDEALPYNEFCKAINDPGEAGDFPNRVAWMICDEEYRRRYTFPAARPGAELPSWVLQAGSLPELAAATGIDAAALSDAVATWNRYAEAGTDPWFGRGGDAYERFMGDPSAPHPNLGPLDQPPFYAVRVLCGTIGTKGGPVTDADARVLTAAGHPVRGLYAAGNAAAFWTADGYPGAGATLGIAMAMGYLAGRHAATIT